MSERYQVLGEIGRGGMGVVYKGRDQDLGRDVALKVLKDEYAARPDVLARFVEEAQIGGQLQHPGIVPVYELGLQSGERPYFAMKLVKGETLAAQLAKRTSPADERRRLLGIFEQVCQTMAYAHARHVVHRDLKPANVMIGAFGEVQVVDWGFAKVLAKGGVADEAKAERASARSVIETARSRVGSGSHSVAGSMMGTPAYMPPEQALGDIERVDERSDVFALGAILCEVLTGAAPYREQDGDLVRQAAKAELGGAHERLARCGADDALVALCEECLAPSQRARPASAGELAQRVSAYLTSVEERARLAEVRAAESRLRHRVTLISAGAGLLLLALAAGAWIRLEANARARHAAAVQRIANAASAASAARGRAQSAGLDAGLWSTAVSSAEQLVELDGGAEAQALLAAVRRESRAAQDESERQQRDRTMVAALEAARIPADEDVSKHGREALRRLDAAYDQAFRAYLGESSLFEQPGGVALASLRRGDIAVELAASLDHWALVRDSLRAQPDAPDAAGTARLRELARQLDGADPWRSRLRELLPRAPKEGERLRELAEQADFDVLPAVACRLLSQGLWGAGERDAAVAVLRRGLELHPRDFDLCFQLALQLEMLDEPRREEALAAYRIAQAIRPEQNEVVHREIQLLSALGRHPEVERLARMLHARDAQNPDWLFHLGYALHQQRRMEDAIACYRQGIALEPADRVLASRLRDLLGLALNESGQYDEAITNERAALELDPTSSSVLNNLGNALYRRGRLEEALANFQASLARDPKSPETLSNIGVVLGDLHRLDESIASFRRAIELDPKNDQPVHNLGVTLADHERLDEAIVCYRRALELRPAATESHLALGRALAKQGKLDEASACFRRAIELAPQRADAHRELGLALLAQDKLDEAVVSMSRAIELEPAFAPTHYNLARAYRGLQKPAQALDSLRRAASLWEREQDAFSVEWLARTRQEIDDLEEQAEREPELLALARGEREPKDGDELAAAALVVYRSGEFALAARTFERAFEKSPELLAREGYDAACCAARAGEGAGDERAAWRDKARRWLEDDLSRSPEPKRLKHALSDPDLAGVRGEALETLPEGERAAWRELWKRIEAGAGH